MSPTLSRVRRAAATTALTLATLAGVGTTASAGPLPTVPHGPVTRPASVTFDHLSVDRGLSPQRAALMIQRIRELYTFWDTGDEALLRQADSPAFVDHTLPAGRRQGLDGIIDASRAFRAAVPDLHCTVADVLVSGDRVSVRQIYTGHFTGVYDGKHGTGQPIRFNAFDIQQVGATQIVGDWHLEDNLTFEQQIGVVS